MGNVQTYAQVGSTNDIVAEWAAGGAPDLSLALADEQTHGRGRAGRRWYSPAGTALAFSILLRPTEEEKHQPFSKFSGLGALAVATALEALYALSPEIKWPNDILLGGRKTAGVLVETAWSGAEPEHIIIGIGINVLPGAVPPPELLRFPATCIVAETPQPVERPALLRQVLEALLAWRETLPDPNFILEWEQRLAFRERPVTLDLGSGGSLHGEIAGLTSEGALNFRCVDGSLRAFPVGELSLRPVRD